MKTRIYRLLTVSLAALCFAACEYDNYEEPTVAFEGQLLYNDQPFLYDGNSARTMFTFLQKGFGKDDVGTPMHIKADGSYRQLLFRDQDYWLTLQNRNYPFEIEEFENTGRGYDTTYYKMSSAVKQDFHVTPYYEISDVSAELVGINIVAKLNVKKVEGTAKAAPRITKVRIYLGTNNYINSKSQVVGSADVDAAFSGTGELSVSVDAIKFRSAYSEHFKDNAYYRVALELENTPDYYLFSDRKEITGIPSTFNDVTSQFLKNYRQPFEVVSYFADTRRGILADWIASNDAIQYTMYDGWGDRLFMCAENWGGSTDLDGCIYQTFTLPKGSYVFIATRGWNWWDVENEGGADHAYFAVARGKGIGWKSPDIIASLDCGVSGSRVSMPLNVTVDADTEVSMGYVVHFPAGETNALSFTAFTIYKAD